MVGEGGPGGPGGGQDLRITQAVGGLTFQGCAHLGLAREQIQGLAPLPGLALPAQGPEALLELLPAPLLVDDDLAGHRQMT